MKEGKTPKQIFERYQKGELDRDLIEKVFISLIEGDGDNKTRLESLEMLSELEAKDPKVIKLIQNLIISDSDEGMRSMSAKILIEQLLSQSHSEVRWALEKEPSIISLLVIIETLRSKNKEILMCFLKEILNDLIGGEASVTRGIRRQYCLNLDELFKGRDIEDFTVEELVEIYLNYRILLGLEDKYDLDANYCHHVIKNGLVDSLELTGLGIESVVEIENLGRLTKLESLDLSGNKIKEISGLDSLEELGYLNLSFNRITEIKNLDALIGLEGLELTGNQISEIKGLDKLVNLESLTLGENQIKKIRGLKKLRNLHELSLGENKISIISGLGKLKNLHHLVLVNNPIKRIKRIKKLKKKMFKDDLEGLIE